MLGEASRILFGCFCHQDPTTLMTVGGELVHLCPRCMGLHLGFTFAFLAGCVRFRRGLVLSRTGPRLILALSVGSLAFDWAVGGHLGLYGPNAVSRLLTGLACGSSLALLLIAYRTSLWSISFGTSDGAGALSVAGVMAASATLGLLAVTLSGWALLTTLCMACVAANITLVVGTTVRMLRVRLRAARLVPLRDGSLSQGGAR
jgi:uncharacterized membrane protein